MRLKRILSLVCVAIITFAFAGCSETEKSDSACLVGIKTPFKEQLEDYFNEQVEEDDIDPGYKIEVKDGWGDSYRLDNSDLRSGQKAVTYLIKGTCDGEKLEIMFYMAYDEDLKVLIPKGYGADEDGDYEEFPTEDLERFIEREFR